MEQIIDYINSFKQSDSFSIETVYLLKVINSKAGFFYHDSRVVFAELSNEGKKTRIETSLLTLITGLKMTSIQSNQKFPDGMYNVIYYNGSLSDNYLESFMRLCSIYADNLDFDFIDFFNSLISIFQLESEKKSKDVIGLFGELIIIKNLYEKYSLNLARYWHLNGKNSKYDFQLRDFNIEVKSSASESNAFILKHSQIFNRDHNLLIIVKLEKGQLELQELLTYFLNKMPFSNDMNFQIKLHECIINLSHNELKKGFSLINAYLYDCRKIDTIKLIPDEINNLIYEYTFDLSQGESIKSLVKLIQD